MSEVNAVVSRAASHNRFLMNGALSTQHAGLLKTEDGQEWIDVLVGDHSLYGTLPAYSVSDALMWARRQ